MPHYSGLHASIQHSEFSIALHLLDLPIFQFQRRRPAEDRRDDPHHALVGDDLVHFAFEVDERAVGDLDLVALLVLGLERWRLRRAARPLRASWPGPWGSSGVGLPLEPMKSPTPSVSLIMNQTLSGMRAVLVQFQLDEDIAGIELAVGFACARRPSSSGRARWGRGSGRPCVSSAFDLDLARQRLADLVFFIARDSQDEELHVIVSWPVASGRNCSATDH